MAELKKLVRGISTAGDIFDNVNGLIDFSKFTDALKLSVNPNAMAIMEGAPTISVSETNPLENGQYFSVSNDSIVSGYRSISSPNMSIFGGGYFQLWGVNSGGQEVINSANVTTRTNPTYLTSTVRLSFLMTGSEFAFKVRAIAGYGSELLIKVDDEFLSLTPTVIPDTNTINYVSVDFGSSKTRRVDIIGYKILFGGVSVSLQDTLVAAERRGPKTFLIGDSFSDGSGNEIGPSLSYPTYIQEYLGIDDLTLSGVGGTGVLRGDSGKANYQFRFQRDIVDLLPVDEVSIVLISLSINDNPYTVGELEAGVQSLIDMLEASGKPFRLFVSSPTIADGAGLMPEIIYKHNTAIRSLVESAGYSYIDEINMPIGVISAHVTTVKEVVSANAKTISTTENLIAGCNYEFEDGTPFFVRSTDTVTRTAVVDNILNAQDNGSVVTLVGSTYLTGNGKVNFPNGWGNCDFAVSADSLHPTNFGHKLKGLNLSNLLVKSVRLL